MRFVRRADEPKSLIAIKSEHGSAYRFALGTTQTGPIGRTLAAEHSFATRGKRRRAGGSTELRSDRHFGG